MGFRQLVDNCTSLSCKLWWKFRSSTSLLRCYIRIKYCFDCHPRHAQFGAGSLQWRRMVQVSSLVEPHMRWLIGNRSVDAHLDNWLDVDISNQAPSFRMRVAKLSINSFIDPMLCKMYLPPDLLNKAVKFSLINEQDKVVWALIPSGCFMVSSSWNCIRQRHEEQIHFSQIWNNLILLKLSFLAWRILFDRLPLYDKIQKLF